MQLMRLFEEQRLCESSISEIHASMVSANAGSSQFWEKK
jgi:hypothetical protein